MDHSDNQTKRRPKIKQNYYLWTHPGEKQEINDFWIWFYINKLAVEWKKEYIV